MRAIFAHRNGYDTILVNNGSAFTVDNEVLINFINALGNDDFSNWNCVESWRDHGNDINTAAINYGETVALYDDKGKLQIVNFTRWEERKVFYLGE